MSRVLHDLQVQAETMEIMVQMEATVIMALTAAMVITVQMETTEAMAVMVRMVMMEISLLQPEITRTQRLLPMEQRMEQILKLIPVLPEVPIEQQEQRAGSQPVQEQAIPIQSQFGFWRRLPLESLLLA